ncbi:MAG: hypothetical protein AB1449_13605 [Chloroflexota bacterium]
MTPSDVSPFDRRLARQVLAFLLILIPSGLLAINPGLSWWGLGLIALGVLLGLSTR